LELGWVVSHRLRLNVAHIERADDGGSQEVSTIKLGIKYRLGAPF
jgi:hypothetical protein